MACLLHACALALAPARLAVMRGSQCAAVMALRWGGREPQIGQPAGAPSLMELSVSYGWCLSDLELVEMQEYQDSLTNATRDYMTETELEQLRSTLEIAYQSRSWSVSARSEARLKHAVAVARVLAELRMEVSAVSAALLAGVCEDAGITYTQIESRLGPTVANAVRDMSNVWRISQLLRSRVGDQMDGDTDREGGAGPSDTHDESTGRGGEWGTGSIEPGIEGVWTRKPTEKITGEVATDEAAGALDTDDPEGLSTDPDETERRCQMMLAGCDDWRGVVLSLASRLVSMRELREFEKQRLRSLSCGTSDTSSGGDVQRHVDELVEHEQREVEEALVDEYDGKAAAAFAAQTLHVFVPIAHRLGMWFFKTELEELCFATIQPLAFKNLSDSLRTVRAEHSGVLEAAADEIRMALRADRILCKHAEQIRVQARMKTAYSAWSKMRRKGITLNDLHDVLGLRIIFKPTAAGRLPAPHHWQRQAILSYRALEVVHGLYPPLPGRRIKDYIACPKQNGYQSLHSSVRLGELRAEVQVRTAEMHRYAEYGKASHWLYKSEESDGLDDWYALAERTRRMLPRDTALRVNLPSNCGKLPSASSDFAANQWPSDENRARPRAARDASTDRVEGGKPSTRQIDSTPAGFSLLESLRISLRERRVYALVRDSRAGAQGGGPQVLALKAGARLEDALAEMRSRGSEETVEDLATATVNGRQVRPDYRIRHGDLLTLVPSAALNSAAWLGRRAYRAASESRGDTTSAGPPVPWPWSLIDEGSEWYTEAELKHGAVAILALCNWLLLCALGETSLGAEPLASLGTSLGAIAWASQFGAVALLEASVMHVATSHAISRIGPDMHVRQHDAEGGDDWRSIPRWLRFLPPADDPASIAVHELSQRMRPISLWFGRMAMIALASLGLRADVDSAAGILHTVLERPNSSPVAELLRASNAERRDLRGPPAFGVQESPLIQRPMERAASLYDAVGEIEPISLDVVMQDIWPDDL